MGGPSYHGNTIGSLLSDYYKNIYTLGMFNKDKGGGAMFNPFGGNDMSNELFGMQKQLFDQTQPLRKEMLGQYQDVFSGKFDPTTSTTFSPSFALAKKGIEDQYGLAKENILGNTARGGGQDTALGQLEQGRAEQAGALPAMLSQQIINDQLNKAYGAVFPANVDASAAVNAQTNLANMWNQNNMTQMLMNSQNKQSNMQGLGSLVGMVLAML